MFSTSKFLVNPPSTVVTDPYFRYTTLLLNDTGTNGAQNNTFIDSSTNNFTITRNGNTTQGSFNPYMPTGYWGGYFDGSGDYLDAPNNTVFDFGSSNFTIESWIFVTSSNQGTIIERRGVTFTTGDWTFYVNESSGIVSFYAYDINTAFAVVSGSGLILNTWNHVAVVRNGNSFNLYLNGTSISSSTSSASFANNSLGLTIGRNNNQGGRLYFTGYISNLRVVKGTAVYTANFAPPTVPLTAITNTSLLCLQDNRFKDNSSNNFTITRNGDTKVTHFNPFAPPASYTTSAYGGSGYFDGSGDYLLVPNNTAFDFGSGNFTVECWFYGTTAYSGVLFSKRANTVSAFGPFQIGFPGSNNVSFLISTSGSSWAIIAISTATAIVNAWNHIALTRNGSSFTLWLNGASVATGTNSSALYVSTDALSIGAGAADGATPVSPINISNIRIVKGTAVYTAAFTPPTAPVTAITNTSLLLNATNAGIYDATTLNDIETVADAKVSTAQAKWGSSSMFFDGTGDYLYLPKDTELDMGSGNFTIEWWMYPTTTSQNATASIIASGNTTWSTGAVVIDCGSNAANKVRFVTYPNGVAVGDPNAWTVNTWTYFAVVRNGNTLTLYRNGTSVATNTSFNTWQPTVNFNYNNATKIAGGHWDGATSYFTGYIEDLRITKGIARYTSNFTAPTAAFPTR